jgi:hypothetical protein
MLILILISEIMLELKEVRHWEGAYIKRGTAYEKKEWKSKLQIYGKPG